MNNRDQQSNGEKMAEMAIDNLRRAIPQIIEGRLIYKDEIVVRGTEVSEEDARIPHYILKLMNKEMGGRAFYTILGGGVYCPGDRTDPENKNVVLIIIDLHIKQFAKDCIIYLKYDNSGNPAIPKS
jgi:hypothetical protein